MDPDSKEIIIAEVTGNSTGSRDAQIGKKMLKKAPKSAKRIFGDGGYDGAEFRREIEKNGAEPIIPPPRGAVVHSEAKDSTMQKRNDGVKEIHGLGGEDQARKIWKS